MKKDRIGVTATAVYSKIQGYLALETGADFIAPYYNRMENLDIDAYDTIACLAGTNQSYGYNTKSWRPALKYRTGECCFAAGAQTATLSPQLLHEAMGMAAIGLRRWLILRVTGRAC